MSKQNIAGDCLNAIRAGLSVTEASKKFKVSRATIYAWKRSSKKILPVRQGASAVVELPARGKLYPTAEDQLAAMAEKIRQTEIQYRELLDISREELSAAKDSIDMLTDIIRQMATRRFRPQYGGRPDYTEKEWVEKPATPRQDVNGLV